MYYKIARKSFLLLGLAFLLFSIFINLVIIFTAKDKIFFSVNDIPKSQCGLLLGTSKYNKTGKKNLFYTYRIEAAEKLLKAEKIDKIILSGSKDVGYDEVSWMKKDLLSRGILEDKIILDKKGDRTAASIKNIKKQSCGNITLISQKFHLERAILLANLDRLNVIGFAAQSPAMIYGSKIYMREAMARLKMIFVDMSLKELL